MCGPNTGLGSRFGGLPRVPVLPPPPINRVVGIPLDASLVNLSLALPLVSSVACLQCLIVPDCVIPGDRSPLPCCCSPLEKGTIASCKTAVTKQTRNHCAEELSFSELLFVAPKSSSVAER